MEECFKMKKLLKSNRAFTLIELLVVIAILAVLATLYVPRILTTTTEAKKAVAIANARTLASEVTMYNTNHTTKISGATINSSTDGLSDGVKTKYAGKKLITKDSFTGDAASLLTGREFPDANYVVILVDSDGNCFIVNQDGTNIGAPTPTPTT